LSRTAYTPNLESSFIIPTKMKVDLKFTNMGDFSWRGHWKALPVTNRQITYDFLIPLHYFGAQWNTGHSWIFTLYLISFGS